MKLIPDVGTVSEQQHQRIAFVSAATKWFYRKLVPGQVWQWNQRYMDQLEADSGVRCQCLGTRLTGFVVVDQKQYMFFKLKYS